MIVVLLVLGFYVALGVGFLFGAVANSPRPLDRDGMWLGAAVLVLGWPYWLWELSK